LKKEGVPMNPNPGRFGRLRAFRASGAILFLGLLALPHVTLAQGSFGALWGAPRPPGAPVESMNLAPGFSTLPKGTKVAVMPLDIELYSISAGGVPEPKADWTEQAHKNFREALLARNGIQGIELITLSEKDADDFADINALHGAVARAISLHHFGPAALHLPTKAGKLDWSLGEVTRAIKDKTGADYALFSWVRDSYASGERQFMMGAVALLSLGQVVPGGGLQQGYASLVDLNTGRVLWFNRMARTAGDLREPAKAAASVDVLLDQFPATK
jgi:hypothetical protein